MINPSEINPSDVIRAMESQGHQVFRNGGNPYNLNIVGIRSVSREANKFDDALCLFWTHQNVMAFRAWQITTDPGIPWLMKPMRAEGTAILAPGQYLRAYRIDRHNGRYEALCQRLGPVRVYRDNNRDVTLDLDPKTHHVGWFGINIHRANSTGITGWVNRHSAGCQVFQSAADFDEFMGLCRKAQAQWGNVFSYTLLDESMLK